MNAPIVLFGFKRAGELSLTLDALKANYLASETDLYVFVDAAKKPDDEPKVKEVHKLLDELTGFKSIYRDYAKANIGCADSIIRGISYVLDRHSSAIMVEDDLITSPNFLDYMNQCLDLYKDNPKAYSIAGYTFPFKKPADYSYDAYFIPRHSPWGWATWADRWKSIDWNVTDYDEFKQNKAQQDKFMEGGADLFRMLRRQIEGEIDAWDIRYGYSQFKAGGITVYPTISKVQNIGFGQDATHTDIFNRYKTTLDDGQKRTFDLPEIVQNTEYYKRKNIQQYSFATRFYNRLKTYAGMR